MAICIVLPCSIAGRNYVDCWDFAAAANSRFSSDGSLINACLAYARCTDAPEEWGVKLAKESLERLKNLISTA